MIAGEEAAGFVLDFGAAVFSGGTVVMLKIVADVCTGARVTLPTLVVARVGVATLDVATGAFAGCWGTSDKCDEPVEVVGISPVDRVVSARLVQKSISVLLLEGNAFTNPSGQASHVG